MGAGFGGLLEELFGNPDIIGGYDPAIPGIGVLLIVLCILSVAAIFTIAVTVVYYVINALGTYRLAKKLGVKYAWLAWIPYAQYYTFGKVVEKCDERRGSKQYPWGKILLLSCAGATLLGSLLGSLYVLLSMIPIIGSLLGMVCYLLIMVLSYATMVLDYICRWKVYREYYPEPANIILFVVGILCGAHSIITLIASFRKPVPAADGVIDDVEYTYHETV